MGADEKREKKQRRRDAKARWRPIIYERRQNPYRRLVPDNFRDDISQSRDSGRLST